MARELDEILSGKEPAETQEPIVETTSTEPTTETTAEPAAKPDETGRLHAPDGKFTSKEAKEPPVEEAAPAAPPAEKPQGGTVPQQALHAAREKERQERDRADDLARQLAELNGKVSVLTQQRQTPIVPVEPPKPVDFWEDPNKFIEQALSPVQQRLAEADFRISQANAFATHGKDKVAAAEQWLKTAIEGGELNGPEMAARLRASRDPVGDVVNLHLNSPSIREAALREQIRAELLAEQGTPQPPAVVPEAAPALGVMPSNLAGARNVGTRSGPAWSGPAPLNDIFDRSRKKAG